MDQTQPAPHSWGRYPISRPANVITPYWRDELPDLSQCELSILPYGYGRSYGDSCLNDGGILLDMHHLNRLQSFDPATGLIRCEAGVSFAQILDVVVPHGWFLPVSPGTKFVSVGGAIANDVHGKNHHKAGTFGCHVTQFALLRSSGEQLICSPTQNSELFCATIGGLGLTGLILWAEFQLKRIVNPYIDMESIRFESLDEFFALSEESDQKYEYSMSWVDLLVGGDRLCRGRFMRGNNNQDPALNEKVPGQPLPLAIPIDFPSIVLNSLTIKAFNQLYHNVQLSKEMHKVVPYNPFFYPLDSIYEWYRMYGKRGFLQYQFVVPFETAREAMREVLGRIRSSGEGSFLTVLKTFGAVKSPGMLSFPRPGLTLALDFSYHGRKTLRLLDDLDHCIIQSGGVVYPAKDARMSPESFQTYYPQWQNFAQYIDPKFSSSFWRRVTSSSIEEPIPVASRSNNIF
ncbi:FAD-binding oxidoreductase [Tengunoibacter tsumagoiensis]|uniref:Oxidoreductase n=1 Tax=Tengunoibacter tsumagoiensis TaxID=2014871 RepID=A0A401ZX58_9CHLR|nr:FAD-binding oxidoreductase [Tengunoibacter tsumagoiensis]GCE11429.1 oxidoreductase [Tengunoibacter tsumagoiensis]